MRVEGRVDQIVSPDEADDYYLEPAVKVLLNEGYSGVVISTGEPTVIEKVSNFGILEQVFPHTLLPGVRNASELSERILVREADFEVGDVVSLEVEDYPYEDYLVVEVDSL